MEIPQLVVAMVAGMVVVMEVHGEEEERAIFGLGAQNYIIECWLQVVEVVQIIPSVATQEQEVMAADWKHLVMEGDSKEGRKHMVDITTVQPQEVGDMEVADRFLVVVVDGLEEVQVSRA